MAAPFVGDRSLAMHKEGDAFHEKQALATTYEMARAQDERAFRHVPNPNDFNHQKGRILSSFTFIEKLQTVCPRAVLVPLGGSKAHYGIAMLDKFQLICRGEFPTMIEWSQLVPWQEKLPVAGKTFKDNDTGVPYEAYEPGMPFEKVVHTSYMEVQRGWRTVLIRYIKAGLISDTDAVRLFGMPDRASWGALLAHVDAEGMGI